MAYNESSKRATAKYLKTSVKKVDLKYKNEEYEQEIKPAIDKSGLPVATFIKQAVEEKIERDDLL